MPLRFLFLPALLLSTLACPVYAESSEPEVSPADKAWSLGQAAMDRDRFEEAIGQFQLSLRLDPSLAKSHLGLAAAHLALGQDREAVPHLASYLRAKPGHFLVRMPYAEVLTRLADYAAARMQLQSYVAAVQEHPAIADEQLITCHTRLMELAEKEGDEYNERLERGMGLYRLAVRRMDLGGADARKIAEELLCKAAAELTVARMDRPGEARPCWYLYLVWHRLGQQQPAGRWLRAADRAAGVSPLTPSERRQLHLLTSEPAGERR